jgi:hypothetical protein
LHGFQQALGLQTTANADDSFTMEHSSLLRGPREKAPKSTRDDFSVRSEYSCQSRNNHVETTLMPGPG